MKKSNRMLFLFLLGIGLAWGIIYWLWIAPIAQM